MHIAACLLGILVLAFPAGPKGIVHAAGAPETPVLSAQLVGAVEIEPANRYSENIRVRICLSHPPGSPQAGRLLRGYRGPIAIEEWDTRIYDGRYGASVLPMTVHAPDGETELTLKSLARYAIYDQRMNPPPRLLLRAAGQQVLLGAPQWVDADGDGKTDWLERRVDHILRRLRASRIRDVVDVIGAMREWRESFRPDCGYTAEDDAPVAYISASCLNDEGVNAHRLNWNQELTATVLHEARHVWAKRHRIRPDPGVVRRYLRQWDLQACGPQRKNGCTEVLRDRRYLAGEADAEDFAQRYEHLVP